MLESEIRASSRCSAILCHSLFFMDTANDGLSTISSILKQTKDRKILCESESLILDSFLGKKADGKLSMNTSSSFLHVDFTSSTVGKFWCHATKSTIKNANYMQTMEWTALQSHLVNPFLLQFPTFLRSLFLLMRTPNTYLINVRAHT